MPRAETERRGRAALIRRWGWGLALALAVVAIATAATFWLQASAAQRLADENAKTVTLLGQVSALQPVRDTLNLESELAAFRAGAMGTDLTWTSLNATVEKALPDGVIVSGFSMTPGNLAVGDDPLVEIGATGTFELTSVAPLEIVPFVRAVRTLPGVLEADGWEFDSTDGGFTYLIRISFDQSVYTGTYTAEGDE